MTLILAGAPIGNSGDSSARLISAISEAEIVAAEDSRRFQRLCQDLNIKSAAKVFSYFEGNEESRTTELIDHLVAGKSVLLITDAGMPSISDPGYLLVEAAIKNKIEIKLIPGPSAVTAALAISGMPSERFCFEGFLSRSDGAKVKQLEELRFEDRTMIFFEAPHRVLETLDEMVKIFGSDRKGCIARELTKTHEEIVRGTLSDLVDWSKSKEMLGEFTLVIAGADKNAKIQSDAEIVKMVKDLEKVGMERKEAIAEVAKQINVPKRNVFSAMVAAKTPLE